MSGSNFNDYVGDTPCTFRSRPLKCTYAQSDDSSADRADALWYHVPHVGDYNYVKRRHPEQLAIAMSMESDRYYPMLSDQRYMAQYDLEMSYRTCSQVPVFYFDYHNETGAKPHITELFQPAMPVSQKKKAIAYVNSNCQALSGRSDIMRKMMSIKSEVPVHSWGRCDRNMQGTGDFDKVQLIHGYMFCIAMENSITKDYITEKLWQALQAGCIPIYLGPHNTKDFLPDPDAVLMYADYGSPEKLLEAVATIANNPAEYERRMAWKQRPWNELSPAFLQMTLRSHVHQPHTRCQMCRLLAHHKMQPAGHKPTYTTCMFNPTWLQDYKLADGSTVQPRSRHTALSGNASSPDLVDRV